MGNVLTQEQWININLALMVNKQMRWSVRMKNGAKKHTKQVLLILSMLVTTTPTRCLFPFDTTRWKVQRSFRFPRRL